MSHTIILGNGIAGTTAARHIRKKSDDRITMISGETDHFFSRTALMYIYMGHMKYEHTKPYEDFFWQKNRIDLARDWIKQIDFENKKCIGSKETYEYDQLVLALGSKPNKFGWPGQDLKGVQGLYSFQDLENMEANTKGIKNAVIVGGGLIGIEMAEMLLSRGIHVTYLVRESNFWNGVLPKGESQLIDRHILEHHVDLRLETELQEIQGDKDDHVVSVTTTKGEEIKADFVGLTVGVSPNIEWLGDTDLETKRGICVDEFLETNIENVYAIGDCAELRNPTQGRRSIEAIWYTGRMMGETVAQTIAGKKTKYQPGIWFNSAKFFDIEYQTYGTVSANPGQDEAQFYWEAADGKHAVRISYHPQNQEIIGVNTLGIRMRHEVWNKWIKEKKTLSEVVKELSQANFDPEFFKSFEPDIQKAFNAQFPDQIIPISKPSFFQRILNA